MYYQNKKNKKIIVQIFENPRIGLWQFPGGDCQVTINPNLWIPIDTPPSHSIPINSYQKPDPTGIKVLPCLCNSDTIKDLDVQGVYINDLGITVGDLIFLNSKYVGTMRISRDIFMSMAEWFCIPNKRSMKYQGSYWNIVCHKQQVTITSLDMSIKMPDKTMRIFAEWYLTPQDKKK